MSKIKITKKEELKNIINNNFNVLSEQEYEKFCDTFNDNFDYSSITDMDSLFYNCKSLQEIPFLKTENVTSMNCMFMDCFNLEELPLFKDKNGKKYSLDTSNVTSMNNIFIECKSLRKKPDLNIELATINNNIKDMYKGCELLEKIENHQITKIEKKNNNKQIKIKENFILLNKKISSYDNISL